MMQGLPPQARRGRRFKVYLHPLCLKGFLLVAMVLIALPLPLGCQKKEKAQPIPPAVESKARDRAPAQAGEQTVPEAPAKPSPDLSFHPDQRYESPDSGRHFFQERSNLFGNLLDRPSGTS